MNVKEGTFYGVGEAKLYYRMIQPMSKPKGVVIVVHGHGDHSGGLQNLLDKLTEHQYIVYAFDLRGHGQSVGTRGFIKKWDEYRGDLHTFRQMVESESANLPLFLIGHSLGGVISLEYCLVHGTGIRGLVAIAPAISYKIKPIEKLLIPILSKIKPDYTITSASNQSLLTKDPKMIKRLNSDGLRHNTVTPGLGQGLLQTVSNLETNADKITLPLLLQFGLKDEITPPEKLRDFFHFIGSKEKVMKEYDEMRHRPFDEVGREQFYHDLIDWLEVQLSK
ncbi:alpha/beta hydrolase [Litchfieldia salsa]|uniref:Lysophospholipase, alpha-beta hydrolase superfamily n=1 Tax=Litchfieldia salsa TaxID=930152 RepID=A0A1H0W345_9BACI|nr:alpha/beta hydrolase [Litchfieldia salsa]SDP85170.1 Lysophospholipase, alpha-beta hydrolase superfamily [Litchfieldia salsa]